MAWLTLISKLVLEARGFDDPFGKAPGEETHPRRICEVWLFLFTTYTMIVER